MSRTALFYLLSALFFTSPVRADIGAIRSSALPQEAAILNALDDVRQLEPYSHAWTQNWTYRVAREDVASRLGKDLGFLRIALQDHPRNAELLLLTSLVAHYAYNVDLAGSLNAAMDALSKAERVAPTDVRVGWFRASLLCQTSQPKLGADEFLAMEAAHPWDRLPAGFWDDYMECATVTAMAAHVLRAADHLDNLHAKSSDMRAFLTEAALKRFDPFDPAKNYDAKEIWAAADLGESVEFTSTRCGLRFRAGSAWKVEDLSYKNHSCVAYFSTGAYQGAKHRLHPSILMMVKQPEGDESLDEFVKRFTSKGMFKPFPPSRCPSDRCLALRGVQTGMYGKDGDGHGRVIAFERNQPDFPGLLFEAPWEMPKSDGSEGLKTYRPDQLKTRMPGKLYYLVVLDAAASIEEPAMRDLDAFLKDLVVE